MQHEIAPAIPYELDLNCQSEDFAAKVLRSFRNPHIDHQWLSITVQYSSKMKMRNIPVLLKHYKNSKQPLNIGTWVLLLIFIL